MKITIDENYDHELEIIIKCKEIDDRVKKIISLLEEKYLIGKLKNQTFKINIDDIYYIEANEDKVFIYSENNIYETNERLYEIENKLSDLFFVRVSKSVILNLNKLSSVKACLNGRYEGTLINGERVMITRHYVYSFKKKLGM